MRRATELGIRVQPDKKISIHALHEEGDLMASVNCSKEMVISIHALHEEGDYPVFFLCVLRPCISIHALHEEGDLCVNARYYKSKEFLSTPSMRRATNNNSTWARC